VLFQLRTARTITNCENVSPQFPIGTLLQHASSLFQSTNGITNHENYSYNLDQVFHWNMKGKSKNTNKQTNKQLKTVDAATHEDSLATM